ncbi:MAG TPA: thioredoxin domain-containing protein, partial [Actinomycetota bacterium]|nr:thioredoxin domain-containing protein [Actinomycetota bacterium]
MSDDRPTNRLATATSPYLLQHAHNPVDWYPWGEEALERARREDRPILLSIGYAACHWCHVMERESFEDPHTAELMNEHFVSIKVDREERPDVDAIYMDAVQAMTGHGGWPLTAFLTPDGKPFYAGTYFPNEDRHGLPAFRKILAAIAEAWTNRREEAETQAQHVVDAIGRAGALRSSGSPLDEELRSRAFGALRTTFDPRWGGFGTAPKFPQPMTLGFVLQAHLRGTDDAL